VPPFKFFISFPTWYTFIFFFYIYNFSLHVSDQLVHHQENQMIIYTCSLCAPFPQSLMCRAWPLVTHDTSTTEGMVPEAARVNKYLILLMMDQLVWNMERKIVNVKKENESVSSWKRNKEFINDAQSTKYKATLYFSGETSIKVDVWKTGRERWILNLIFMKKSKRLKMDKWQLIGIVSSCGTFYRHSCRGQVQWCYLAITTFESSKPSRNWKIWRMWLCQCLKLSLIESIFLQFLGVFAKLLKATISFVLSIRLSVHVEQLGSMWMDFQEVWFLSIFLKSFEEIQVSVKSDKNNGYFTWSLIYIYDHISLSSS